MANLVFNLFPLVQSKNERKVWIFAFIYFLVLTEHCEAQRRCYRALPLNSTPVPDPPPFSATRIPSL